MPRVFIIGAGPGSSDLLTLGAYRALQEAQVVLYDRLVSIEVRRLIPASATQVFVGKLEGEQQTTQNKIYQYFVRYVSEGKRLVRLKGGDALVFGRGIEEWLFLKELGCEVQIIPGISSAIAVPELAGIPVTARGISHDFTVVTGQNMAGMKTKWEKYALVDTLVILMGVKRRKEIARALIAAGRDPAEPVAFIQNGSCPNQRIVRSRLREVAAGNSLVQPPAVFVIGAVTQFHEKLFKLELSLADMSEEYAR